jgi:hypothetical protein
LFCQILGGAQCIITADFNKIVLSS